MDGHASKDSLLHKDLNKFKWLEFAMLHLTSERT